MIHLCIDPGISHTGAAIADESNLATPVETLHHKDKESQLRQLMPLIEKYQPDALIIGQPEHGPIYKLSEDLKKTLSNTFKGTISLHPEDLSSREAVIKLVESGMSKTRRREMRHSAAAALILQDYLDMRPVNR